LQGLLRKWLREFPIAEIPDPKAQLPHEGWTRGQPDRAPRIRVSLQTKHALPEIVEERHEIGEIPFVFGKGVPIDHLSRIFAIENDHRTFSSRPMRPGFSVDYGPYDGVKERLVPITSELRGDFVSGHIHGAPTGKCLRSLILASGTDKEAFRWGVVLVWYTTIGGGNNRATWPPGETR
jgi:hypothetical protein